MNLVSTLLLILVVSLGFTTAAGAEVAVVPTDSKVMLVDGKVVVPPNPPADTVAVVDLDAKPPRVIAQIDAPASVVGPPLSVAVAPDESIALVTAAMKLDPADATKMIPDNRMSVIDLKSQPPRVIATLETGKSPAGVSINRQGTLALVANRADGTVSVFTIQGPTVTPAGTVKLGDDKSAVSHVAIAPDGKSALATRTGDDRISVLSIDATKVAYTKRDLFAGLGPYGIDIASHGRIAVVANVGRGAGDNDTISLIDLQAKPPRVVETVTVGQTPEGIKLSPDGSVVAVVAMNGSNKPKPSPFFNDHGKLVLFRVDGTSLRRIAEAPLGHWSQGAGFSRDGRTIVVCNMVEKELQVFELSGDTLRDTGVRLALKGGPVAIRTAEK